LGADNLISILNTVNYNARVFVTLVCFCLLLNSGGAAYLLVQADFERWKKTVFVLASVASLALKIILATRGHNYDLESYGIVAQLVLQGRSVYANTTRFNYGPLWAFLLAGLKQLSTLLPVMGGEAFHVAIAAFLGVTDVALAAILSAKYRYGAGIFFLCCPATILLTGYHSQFENFALLAGLAAWMLIRKGSTKSPQLVLAAGLQGLSLIIKHVLFLFPFWVLLWPQMGSWRKRAAYVVIAYGVFALSFLPWMLDPPSRAGIYQNVFHYRSEFTFSLSRLIASSHPFAGMSPTVSSVLTYGWMAAVIAVGIVAAHRKGAFFSMYLLTMFAFSPALRDQYLAIALLACAILISRWPSWALVGTATLAVICSPSNLFQLPFNMVYYFVIVSTQICALGLLMVELRRASPAPTTPSSTREAVRSALTLAFASSGLVLVIFLIKSWVVH
jgi:hypothetical protein